MIDAAVPLPRLEYELPLGCGPNPLGSGPGELAAPGIASAVPLFGSSPSVELSNAASPRPNRRSLVIGASLRSLAFYWVSQSRYTRP
jgi:hypothetical protein